MTAEPTFTDPARAASWAAARRRATELVLAGVAGSAWADHLALRGSELLRVWFGAAAREPRDLDFVVVPREWRADGERTAAMLEGLAAAARQAAEDDGGVVRFGHMARQPIGPASRLPGWQLTLPWSAGGLPGGVIRLDLEFNERMPIAPEPVILSGGTVLKAADRELVLAWKVMWLLTDEEPRAKDLYDAVLLAEHGELGYDLLRAVFLDASPWEKLTPVVPAAITELADAGLWMDFADRLPGIGGDGTVYGERLSAALAPTFRTPSGETGEAALRQYWIGPWVDQYRGLLARKGMRRVQREMADAGTPLVVAIAITRELLGGERCRVEDARERVMRSRARSLTAAAYRLDPDRLDEELRGWER